MLSKIIRRFQKSPDFEALIDIAMPALREIILAAQSALGDERIYAVVLTTYGCNEGLGLHINTEENLERILDDAEISQSIRDTPLSEIYNGTRWYWGEWGDYEYIGNQDVLNAAYDWMVKHSDEARNFERFQSQIHQTMIEILRRLDAEGLFGQGAKREAILCFAGVYDDCERIIYRSAKAANSDETWTKTEPFLRAAFG